MRQAGHDVLIRPYRNDLAHENFARCGFDVRAIGAVEIESRIGLPSK